MMFLLQQAISHIVNGGKCVFRRVILKVRLFKVRGHTENYILVVFLNADLFSSQSKSYCLP